MIAMTGVPEQGVAPKPRVASVPGGVLCMFRVAECNNTLRHTYHETV